MRKILLLTNALLFIATLKAQVNCDSLIKIYDKAHNSTKLFLFKRDYFIAGDFRRDSIADPAVYVTRLDECGNKKWKKKFAYNTAQYKSFYTRAVDQSAITGDIFAAISADSSVPQTRNQIRLIKINAKGELLWTSTYKNSLDNVPYSVHATPDGGALVGGWTGSWAVSNNSSLLVKFSNTGKIEWSKTYAAGTITGIDIMPGDNYEFIRYLPKPHGLSSFLYRTDNKGHVKWLTKTPPVHGPKYYDNYTTSAIQFAARNVDSSSIVVRTNGAGFYPDTIFITKYNYDGVQLWNRQYAFLQYQEIFSVENTSDDGYLLTGSFYINNDTSGIYAIKLDANGDTVFTHRVISSTHTIYPLKYYYGSSGYQLTNDEYVFAGTLQSNIEKGNDVVVHFASILVKLSLPSSAKAQTIAQAAQRNISQMHIYPNPANTFCTIDFGKSNVQMSEIHITDMFGRIIKKIMVDATQRSVTLNTLQFSKGMYWVEMIGNNKIAATAKLVVQ